MTICTGQERAGDPALQRQPEDVMAMQIALTYWFYLLVHRPFSIAGKAYQTMILSLID